MSYEIAFIPLFDKQTKRLGKKYPSLKNDLAKLIESLTFVYDKSKKSTISDKELEQIFKMIP